MVAMSRAPPASLDAVFGALADLTRHVAAQLSAGQQPVTSRSASFSMAQPSFLQHIRVTGDCSVARRSEQGRARLVERKGATLSTAAVWRDAQRARRENRLVLLERHLLTPKDPE